MNCHRPRIARSILEASLLVLFMFAGVRPAFALTARVPEDFSTIQAAVDHIAQFDAVGSDTVLVRAGNYPERVVIRETVRLQVVPAPGSDGSMARIDGLTVEPPSNGKRIVIIGIHVTGPARTADSDGRDRIYYESCRFDAGMTGPSWYIRFASMVMRRCTLFGRVTLAARETIVDSCVVYGPLDMEGGTVATVTNNRFEDVPGLAASIFGGRHLRVAQNVVFGGGSGFEIWEGDTDHDYVVDNRIEGCAGFGLRVSSWRTYKSFIERNHVSHCAGTGIWARGIVWARENRVLDCGGHGLDIVEMDALGLVESNVVGRCGGDGIRVQKDYELAAKGSDIQGNTVYDCAGSGFRAFGLTVGKVTNNIAFRNLGYGLLTIGSEAVPVSCNDWFENKSGATSAVQASASDLAVDPLFCDLAAGDAQLQSNSPLLDVPGCGLIGALGQGCEPPVSIEFEISPAVLPPVSRGRWIIAWLEPGGLYAAGDVEVASVRLNDSVEPGNEGALGDRDHDGIPDLQLRFDRVALGSTLGAGDEATVIVTGRMRGQRFVGSTRVRLRGAGAPDRPTVRSAVLTIRRAAVGGTSDRIRVAFTLADEGPARLEVLDVAGRVIESRDVTASGADEYRLDLGTNGRFAQGIYFLRLRQGMSEARTRIIVVR